MRTKKIEDGGSKDPPEATPKEPRQYLERFNKHDQDAWEEQKQMQIPGTDAADVGQQAGR